MKKNSRQADQARQSFVNSTTIFSFMSEEKYAFPENVLEIEVCNPEIHGQDKDKYTDYEVICRTNLPLFKLKESSTRRRYSEFVQFRDTLVKDNPHIAMVALPSKTIFKNRFDQEIIEKRMKGLEQFLQQVASHPLIQTGPSSKLLVSFIQDATLPE